VFRPPRHRRRLHHSAFHHGVGNLKATSHGVASSFADRMVNLIWVTVAVCNGHQLYPSAWPGEAIRS
jgi:hypothetical protein